MNVSGPFEIRNVLTRVPSFWWALGATLIAATVLRLHGLSAPNFTHDESVTIDFARMSLEQIVAEIVAWETHPPLYYSFIHFIAGLFGESEFALRLPSVVFSVASVYMTYKVGTLLLSRYIGLASAFLMAFSPFSIQHAQNARMYSLLTFVSLVSIYWLMRWQRDPQRRLLLYYGVSTLVLLYTHVYGVFIVFAENAYVASMLLLAGRDERWPRLKSWIVGQLALLVAAAPWLAVLVMRTLQLQERGFWISEPTLRTFRNVFARYAGDSEAMGLWAFLLILGVLSAALLRRGSSAPTVAVGAKRIHGIFVAALFLVIVNLVPFAISKVATPMYTAKYTLGAYFGFFLLVAAGTEMLGSRAARNVALATLAVFSLSPIFGSADIYMSRAQQREAIAYLQPQLHSGDSVVLCGDSHLSAPFEIYASRAHVPNEVVVAEAGRLDKPIVDTNRVWLVRMTERMEGCEDIASIFGTEFAVAESTSRFRRLEIMLLTNTPEGRISSLR